jgi:hypothetical protein
MAIMPFMTTLAKWGSPSASQFERMVNVPTNATSNAVSNAAANVPTYYCSLKINLL